MPSAVNSKPKPRPSRVSAPVARTSLSTTTPSEWVEPTLQQAKPSYEDHGGAPYGVLEDMQPLGSRPNAKVRNRVKGEQPLRKSLGGKLAGAVSDAQDTPESTPAYEAPPPLNEVSSSYVAPVVDNECDQDYAPQGGKKPTRSSRLSKTPATPSETPKPVSVTPGPSAAANSTSKHRSVSPATQAFNEMCWNRHKMPKLGPIIEGAVRRSREVGDPDLGLAIQELYVQSFSDDHVTELLDAVLRQKASTEQVVEFRSKIKRARKDLKARERRANETVQFMMDDAKKRREAALTNGTISGIGKPKLKLHLRPTSPVRPSVTSTNLALQDADHQKAVTAGDQVDSPAEQSLTASSHAAPNGITQKHRERREHSRSESAMSITSNSMVSGAEALLYSPGAVLRGIERVEPSEMMSTEDEPSVVQPTQATSSKRSHEEADLAHDAGDGALVAKKQRMQSSSYKDEPTQASVTESSMRRTLDRSRATRQQNREFLRNKPSPVKRNGLNHQQQRPGTPDATTALSAEPDSPLTDLTSVGSSDEDGPPPARLHDRVSKKGAKTKQSPEKKQKLMEQDGSGGLESPSGYDDSEASENHNYCNSCGAAGFLLCCDGCERSFHFTCLDPPLTADASELDEPWFCHTCIVRRDGPNKAAQGLFSGLLNNLEKRNPVNYTLPANIREYFDGVATGKDGKFAEPTNAKTRSRAGYDEPLDLLKTRDNKGQTILCYSCGKSSAGQREIITCDYCAQHWHLDCTNPPLANPPFRDQWNRKARDWMCPLHTEHDLREMEASRIARPRTFFMRRPRNAKVYNTALRRGQINSGIVEVEDDSSSDEEMDVEDDETTESTVVRLPARGIKLDFIDRVKNFREEQARGSELQLAAAVPNVAPLAQDAFTQRSMLEKRTALSLLQMATSDDEIKLGADSIANLLSTLIAEAPAEVVDQVTAAENAIVSEQERQQLLQLQELISRKLAEASVPQP